MNSNAFNPEDRLRALLSRGVPLVEFACTLRKGVSGEVACEAVNRLSVDLIGYVQGNPGESWARSLIVQMDPRAAQSMGIALARVAHRPDDRSAGFVWECYDYGRLGALTESIVENILISNPGQFDDAQPWPE